MRKSKRDLRALCLPSAHFPAQVVVDPLLIALPALTLITPLFVLIEYLLGYLLLITGSRCRSVPSVHTTRRPIVKCTAEPAAPVAPSNLWRGRPDKCASASHSSHKRHGVSPLVSCSVAAADRRRVNQKIIQQLNPSASQALIPSCQLCDCRAIVELQTGDEHGA